MFEKVMADRLRRIFDLEKVSYDRPGESQEQQGLFIEVTTAHARIKDQRQIARVVGVLHVFANQDKLPFGYFAKKIEEAKPNDTRGFFFGPEENVGTFRNIAERKFDFTFLFDSQYDPAIGSIDQVNFTLET